MSGNKDKQVSSDDANNAHEELASPVSSDCEIVQKGQANFEANFARMSVEVGAKPLLGGFGLSFEPENGFSGSACNVRPDEKRLSSGILGGDQAVQAPWSTNKATTFCDLDKSIWKKYDILKARNQWEYSEWCKARLLLDKALLSGDIEYVYLARQVVLERVYVVRVANKDGWSVVFKIASSDNDPMSDLFGERQEKARLAAQHFLRYKRPKVAQEYSFRRSELHDKVQM
ncbi:6458_t:CDS:2 [Racocetra persica]|uniref:6458_t:CDS:1 n=1 Tax=Racocetra persica TaxID=160502 RepID=A0ACA9KB86_9GLOM|nr:6458_t:CDS:2 [Racocetra persica]